jgi:hypothetical protein
VGDVASNFLIAHIFLLGTSEIPISALTLRMHHQYYTNHLHAGEFGISLSGIIKAAGLDRARKQKFVHRKFLNKSKVTISEGIPSAAYGTWTQLGTALEACNLLSMFWMKLSLEQVYAVLKPIFTSFPPL